MNYNWRTLNKELAHKNEAEVLALFQRSGFPEAASIGSFAAGPARVEVA